MRVCVCDGVRVCVCVWTVNADVITVCGLSFKAETVLVENTKINRLSKCSITNYQIISFSVMEPEMCVCVRVKGFGFLCIRSFSVQSLSCCWYDCADSWRSEFSA